MDILLCGNEKTYFFNDEAFDLMETFNIAKIWQQKLSAFKNKIFSDEEMHRKLDLLFLPDRHKTTRKRVLEACAIASYHQMTNIPVVTRYLELDERISKTKGKKESLLIVLNFPGIPLHNNGAELGVRVKVRKRDVSLQTIKEEGTKANDTFMTIVQTAKKLGVSAYQYM